MTFYCVFFWKFISREKKKKFRENLFRENVRRSFRHSQFVLIATFCLKQKNSTNTLFIFIYIFVLFSSCVCVFFHQFLNLNNIDFSSLSFFESFTALFLLARLAFQVKPLCEYVCQLISFHSLNLRNKCLNGWVWLVFELTDDDNSNFMNANLNLCFRSNVLVFLVYVLIVML